MSDVTIVTMEHSSPLLLFGGKWAQFFTPLPLIRCGLNLNYRQRHRIYVSTHIFLLCFVCVLFDHRWTVPWWRSGCRKQTKQPLNSLGAALNCWSVLGKNHCKRKFLMVYKKFWQSSLQWGSMPTITGILCQDFLQFLRGSAFSNIQYPGVLIRWFFANSVKWIAETAR